MTAEREGLAEIAGVVAESIAGELYASLMEASADHWRRWEYMTDFAKEKYRAESARIVAEAVTPALADLLAARDRRVRGEARALRLGIEFILHRWDQLENLYPETRVLLDDMRALINDTLPPQEADA